MKTAAKRLLTALTIGTVVFAVGMSSTEASAQIGSSTAISVRALDSEEQAFWDKFRDSVMKDKPAPAENPSVVDRKPVEPPKEVEKPKEIERRAIAMSASTPDTRERNNGLKDRNKSDGSMGRNSNSQSNGEVQTRNPSGIKAKMPEAKAPKPVPTSPSPPYQPVQPPYLPPQPPYAP